MTEYSLPRLSSALPHNTMNERVCFSVSFFVSAPVAKVTGSRGKINLLLRLRPRTTRDPRIPSSLFTRCLSTFYDSDNCFSPLPSSSFHSMEILLRETKVASISKSCIFVRVFSLRVTGEKLSNNFISYDFQTCEYNLPFTIKYARINVTEKSSAKKKKKKYTHYNF